MAKDYTGTLNLPKTEFPMRANLPVREPELLKAFEEKDIYHKMLEKRNGAPTFVLHDGPPFSNGNIHMGTAMNKILKDFINKYKSMAGYRVPYIPGWDNHGMPIESAIIKQSKLDRKKMSVSEFRTRCQDFAQNYVNIQMGQFKRLGVIGDWDHPYLTMNPSFEARELKVFGKMFEKGYIYKGLKPVYWCPKDETALAEAEIEYQDDPCTSVYVKFRVADDKGKLSPFCDLSKTYFVIWTTTIWTLPGNQAIALNPDEEYGVFRANGEFYIMAKALAPYSMEKGGIDSYECVATLLGRDFEYMTAYHPFLDRTSLLVNADYVTMDSGTGCVHTAGGFGADDYVTSRRYNIDVIVPVDDRGYQTEDAGKFAGQRYDESNKTILADLIESGALFASENIVHSYPHCWRCKSPIIFRATPQWFCSVDAFKEDACKAAEQVDWIPAWGGERMLQMIRERADWCISRQRHWGLPIPVLYCADCKKPICTKETIDHISDIFAEKGSNAWFDLPEKELLPKGFRCSCGCTEFTKETNTLDGWFDSGSSHFAVLEDKPDVHWPADLYLEGADQYRGWFQSSMLTAVGAKGQGAPYKQVLTHGWVVDGEGKAMHKSLGNSIAPEEVIVKYGAELVRLWVASSDYQVDVRVSDPIFKQLSESYRKIRNTARIILANLGDKGSDFDPDQNLLPAGELAEIDRWLLSRYNKLVKTVRNAYDNYQFHVVYHEILNFCTVELSKIYIDITKDRVYTEKRDSLGRRQAQSALYMVLDGIVRLLAPILAFTSDEIWQMMPHSSKDDGTHVLLNDLPSFDPALSFEELEERYDRLFEMRDDVLKALEEARNSKLIGKSLEATVELYTEDDKEAALLESFGKDLATVFIVSGVSCHKGAAPEDAYKGESSVAVRVRAATGCKCDRCWTVGAPGQQTEDGGFLCFRCLENIQ